jgi:hypothetical protein
MTGDEPILQQLVAKLMSCRLTHSPTREEGTVTFYLDHKTDIDKFLEERAHEFEANTIPLSEANPARWEKLERARVKMGDPRP